MSDLSTRRTPWRRPLAGWCRFPVGVGACLLGLAMGISGVQAGPQGGQVVAGSGGIATPDATTTVVQQNSPSMAVNWQSFDVGAGELVRFQQPSATAAVLNRVLNQLPSQIYGSIEANGQVFIMNPRGVVFGAGAKVDVGALFATSLDIGVDDFMQGRYAFSAVTSPFGPEPGLVVNRGLIHAATGHVVLLGGAVENQGKVVADVGNVVLGAGRQAVIDFDGDGMIRFQLEGKILSAVAGATGAVVNGGEIESHGGQVLLEAQVARSVFDHAINNDGVIRASRIDLAGGRVRLAAVGAEVRNAGRIDASGAGSGGEVSMISDVAVSQDGTVRADGAVGGGQIRLDSDGLTLLGVDSVTSATGGDGGGGDVLVLGDQVAVLTGATADASGGLGGGTVLVGGNLEGADPSVRNATSTGVAPGARLLADARDRGDGGTVAVWSDGATSFLGHISAKGGDGEGDGGLAEVAGKQSLAYGGHADLGAPAGDRGTLRLATSQINIRGGTRDVADPAGTTPAEILFTDLGPTILYESTIELESRSADINLRARTEIVVDPGQFDHDSANPGDTAVGTLAIAPDSHLVLELIGNGPGNAGRIDLTGSDHGSSLAIVTSGTGTITIATGGDRSAQVFLPNLTSGSDVIINGLGGVTDVSIQGVITGHNVDIDATGTVSVPGGGRVLAGGDGTALTIDAGTITIADAAPDAPAIANTAAGDVSLTAGGASNIELGEHALATGSGRMSLDAGGSILASNLTDASDTSNEITARGVVSLRAGDDIGQGAAQIEIAGATELMLDLGGNLHVSGSDGVGGPGPALTRLALTLEPDRGGAYVLENFAGQTFTFSGDPTSDAFVIEELVSASAMNLHITTRNEGMLIGNGGADGGIRLAGTSDVTLESARDIGERTVDDGGPLRVEVSTDGTITLVAGTSVGESGALELASASSGTVALAAKLGTGSLNVRALDGLAIVGDIDAPGGGELAGRRLDVHANVSTGADMRLRAVDDPATTGNDLRIDSGAVVSLTGAAPATISLEAGDHVDLAAGKVQTTGSAGHRIRIVADGEGGGADGSIGAVVQSTDDFMLVSPRVDLQAGGGIGEVRALSMTADAASVANTTSGDVRLTNQGDLALVDVARNAADGGLLAVTTVDGGLDTGLVPVATNGGTLALEARDTSADGSNMALARIRIGSGGLDSAGGAITAYAAEGIGVQGAVASGGGNVDIHAGRAASEMVADGVGDLQLEGDINAGNGEVILGASGNIVQGAGRIAATSLAIAAGGMATLTSASNALARFSGTADGDVTLRNGSPLELHAIDAGSGRVQIDNAGSVRVAGRVAAGDEIRITTTTGDIDGGAGRLSSARLTLDSAGGIGRNAVLRTLVGGDIDVISRGVGAAGDIRLLQEGMLAARQFTRLATDTGSGQTVSIGATGVLALNADPIVTPNIQLDDKVEFAGSSIDISHKLSGLDTDVRFLSPVTTSAPEVAINFGSGLATFDGNVSPGPGRTLRFESPVVFASGRVTGAPDSSLIINNRLDLAVNTTIQVDNLRLNGDPGSLTGSGNLTLLPATNGKNITIGGDGGLVPDMTLASLTGFGGGRQLSIGVPLSPTASSPFAGNVQVMRGLDVGNAVLTVGGLGDVTLYNHGNPLASDREVVVVAIGDRTVFPGLVASRGGDIVDVSASPGAAPVVDAPLVHLVAQGRVGVESNAFDVRVGSGGRVEFVTGASNAFINTIPGAQSVVNVALTSPVLASFRALGFFGGPLNLAALGRAVGLETTGLETTGLGELGFVDEGVFLLPDPFTMPVQATLLPALMDPGFPSDRRPLDPDNDGDWRSFYDGALRQYVESRYLASAKVSEAERAAVRTRIDAEWRALVGYFEGVRARERGLAAGAAKGRAGG